MSYHNDLIKLITSYPQDLEDMIEFPIGKLLTNIHYHYSPTNNMELDIMIIYANKKTIIEVKSHYGLRNHFLTKQYPRFIQKFPSAKIFFMYSTVPNSLNINDIEYEEIIRIRN